MAHHHNLPLTRHAEARANQRGIRDEVIALLLHFGEVAPAGGGAEALFMDHKAREELRRVTGASRYARLERQLDTYLILGNDGRVRTVAPRRKRIFRG